MTYFCKWLIHYQNCFSISKPVFYIANKKKNKLRINLFNFIKITSCSPTGNSLHSFPIIFEISVMANSLPIKLIYCFK